MPGEYITTREHEFYTARCAQWALNDLALKGGTAYINQRLTRFPAETDIDWEGDSDKNITGRRQRAFLVNYCRRLATKLNQYVFATAPEREGVDPAFEDDASTTGQGLHDFMKAVSDALTANKFAWVLVDRPAAPRDEEGNPRAISAAEKANRGDRVYWTVVPANEVLDWHHDAKGDLVWLLRTRDVVDNTDPFSEPVETTVYELWERGQLTTFTTSAAGALIGEEAVTPLSIDAVPWVLFGTLDDEPWWFDDVELIMRSLLDLQSAYDQALFDAVYVQKVLPADAIQALLNLRDNTSYDSAVGMVLSHKHPVLESEGTKGITRFLVPSRDISVIREEINARKKDLYEVVGMALQQETGQVKSGAALAWEHLDPEAFLADRAAQLEDGERKCVALSTAYDAGFKAYEPAYTRTFDTADLAADIDVLIKADGVELPETAQRVIKRAILQRLRKVQEFNPTPEEWTKILAELDEMDLSKASFEDFLPGAAQPGAAGGEQEPPGAGEEPPEPST